tara:strand:+ start:946 stop:1782 length:837 start_codon:yes stop_codon:yes gene_type:complete
MTFVYTFSFSQMTSKNGHIILPENGDWAIQMDATSLINTALNALNIMNDNGYNAPSINYVSGYNNTIVGKYYNSEKSAIRVKFSIRSLNESIKIFGDNPTTIATENQDNIENNTHIRTETESYWNVAISAGKEFRKGHNRLQGFYGAEGTIILSSGDNNWTNTNIDYEFNTQDFGPGTYLNYDKNDVSFGLGLRGFVGIEYFPAPKISIGAEFGWSANLTMSPQGSESIDVVSVVSVDEQGNPTYTSQTTVSSGGSSSNYFWFNVDNMNAALTAAFHF